MATFADAINALIAERDRQFVLRIATEYSLNFEELNKKYLETAEMAIKVPRKYTKKAKEPKSVTVAEGTAPDAKEVTKAPKAPKEKPCCTAQTSKKEPCKFSALKGEVFCKRHLKQSLEETAPKEPKAAKVPKKVVKKAEQPVHTHPLTSTDPACDLCASHGNPLEEGEQDFEVVMPSEAAGPVKQLTTAQRLAAILDSGDSDEEVEGDDEIEVHLGQEEYEEED